MQATESRSLTGSPRIARRALWLALAFGVAAALLVAINRQPEVADARWPAQQTTFSVDGWAVGPETVEAQNGNHYVSRLFRSPDARASLSITTSPEAKRVYRAGADLPFLGNGYTVDPAPPSLVAPSDAYTAAIVRREGELGLLLYAYGERRGLTGNGIPGWALVTSDGVLGRPNDYYLLRLYTPLTELDASETRPVAELAGELFPQIAAWYGA
jgi:hypothetical protein